jgi:signal transduction histidine kinase
VGFDASRVREKRFGLHGIRERVRLLGKQLTIDSRPGAGTRIEAIFPLIYRKDGPARDSDVRA